MRTVLGAASRAGLNIQLGAAGEIRALQESGRLDAWLAPSEREFVARLRSTKRRDDWLAGRIAAKRAIAHYLEGAHRLNVPASEIVVDYDDQGRPRPKLLSSTPHSLAEVECLLNGVSLSLAHSDGWGVAAVTQRPKGGQIGVDLQRIRPVRADLAARTLNPSERSQLNERFCGREIEGFFIYWTLKEATLKALGSGLRLPMRALDVHLATQTRHAEVQIHLPSGPLTAEAHYWSEPEGLQAALVRLKRSV